MGVRLCRRYATQVLCLNCRDLSSFASQANISTSSIDPISINNPNTGIRSLLHYAIENLPEHVRQAPARQNPHAQFAIFLQSDNGRAWMRHFWMVKIPSQPHRQFSPLEFCLTTVLTFDGQSHPQRPASLSEVEGTYPTLTRCQVTRYHSRRTRATRKIRFFHAKESKEAQVKLSTMQSPQAR
jgi:hypothetical protein